MLDVEGIKLDIAISEARLEKSINFNTKSIDQVKVDVNNLMRSNQAEIISQLSVANHALTDTVKLLKADNGLSSSACEIDNIGEGKTVNENNHICDISLFTLDEKERNNSSRTDNAGLPKLFKSCVGVQNIIPWFNKQLEDYKQEHKRKCKEFSITQRPIQSTQVISDDECESNNDINPLCFQDQIEEYKKNHNDKFKRNIQKSTSTNQQDSRDGNFLLKNTKYGRVKIQKNRKNKGKINQKLKSMKNDVLTRRSPKIKPQVKGNRRIQIDFVKQAKSWREYLHYVHQVTSNFTNQQV